MGAGQRSCGSPRNDDCYTCWIIEWRSKLWGDFSFSSGPFFSCVLLKCGFKSARAPYDLLNHNIIQSDPGLRAPAITDTSFVQTELFIPGTGKSIHWFSLNSTRCGIVRTLVRQHLFCPINRFSEKVNLANVETSLLCALIYLSPMKGKTEIKTLSWKHVDVPNATVHRIGWIVDVNFRLYLASNELRRERFCLSNMQISDLWAVSVDLFQGMTNGFWGLTRDF